MSKFDLERDPEDRQSLHFRVVCSKGTYIRSLAHDLVRPPLTPNAIPFLLLHLSPQLTQLICCYSFGISETLTLAVHCCLVWLIHHCRFSCVMS